MQTEDHIGHLAAESAEALDLAQRHDFDRPVPGCDGWTVREVITHVGELLRWSAEIVATGRQEAISKNDLTLTPPADDSLLEWAAEAREFALTTFSTHDPAQAVWSFAGDHRGRFWPRRMLFEVVVHRTDIERALGLEPVIGTDLLVEGIEEHLALIPWTAATDATASDMRGKGETIALEADDGPRWRIILLPGGFIWDRSSAPTTATLKGSLFDLYMSNQGRPNGCRIEGDVDLHARTLGALTFVDDKR